MLWVIIGALAAVLTMLSFIPQVIKSLKNKSVNDLSGITLFQLALGTSLWIIYGIHRKDLIIIVANCITLLSLSILIFLFFSYKKIGGIKCRL